MMTLAEVGIPVMWVPGPDTLKALLAADEGDYLQVLEDHRIEVCIWCSRVLDDVETAGLAELADGLREAIATLDTGHARAAQALVGAILDPILVYHCVELDTFDELPQRKKGQGLGWKGLQERLSDLARNNCIPLKLLRETLTLVAVRPAIEEDYPPAPPLARFNRHTTAHRFSAAQYTTANALVGLLLAVSLVRHLADEPDVSGCGDQ